MTEIKGYSKTTVGFVAQTFHKRTDGKFECTKQEFIAGDEVDRENFDGDNIEDKLNPQDETYQPFDMV